MRGSTDRHRRPFVRANGGRLGVVGLFFMTIAVVGLAVTLGSGYLIVRGPFLGGPTLDPVPLFGTFGAFVVGIVLFSWGSTKALGIGSRV
jgi:vacuolar-type H+-ATPase subunit I/STV1